MLFRLLLSISLVFVLYVANVFAEQGMEESELTEGFDMFAEDSADGVIDITEAVSAEKRQEDISRRSYRLGLAWQIGARLDDPRDIISHRSDIRLRWERLFGQSNFLSVDGKIKLRLTGDQQLGEADHYQVDTLFREAALQGSFGPVSIKTGYQTIIWGEMDSARINDIMSPWDYSEFAFTSPEDARVGQPAILLEGYFSRFRVAAVLVPLPLTNRYPGGGADSLLGQVLGTSQYAIDDSLPQAGEDIELGLRIGYTLGASDLAFYLASIISDDPLFRPSGLNSEGVQVFSTDYPDYQLGGFSANYGRGNFLWKTEWAYKKGLYFPAVVPVIRDVVEGAVGFDFNANGAYSLTVEVQNQTILPGEGELVGLKTHNSQAMLRWSKSFLHETLSSVYYYAYQLQYGDTTHSAALQYAMTDYWRISLNAALFQIRNQDSPGRFVDDWDQVSVQLSLDI